MAHRFDCFKITGERWHGIPFPKLPVLGEKTVSIAKRIWELEQMAGMDPADGSTAHSGLASYKWTIDADHMDALEFFVESLRMEFGEKAVTQGTDENDCAVVTLHFNYPFKDLEKKIDIPWLLSATYKVISKIDEEIYERQMETGQAFSMAVEATREDVWVKYAGINIWNSEDAGIHALYNEESLEREIREALAKTVEAIKMVEGVG